MEKDIKRHIKSNNYLKAQDSMCQRIDYKVFDLVDEKLWDIVNENIVIPFYTYTYRDKLNFKNTLDSRLFKAALKALQG